MRLFAIFKDILGNLVKGPVTRNYPAFKREPFPGERGKLVIEEDKCIFCGMCAKKCPSNALKVTRQPKEWNFEQFRCILCGTCVEACPKKCLKLLPRLAEEASKE
ncbi:MAG: 4Fe-4S binding protein [Lentisphaeria bacterium]|nr:4Fe-4S binding protein [Lentisphaeria bacterium]